MKKIFATVSFLAFVAAAFCQAKKDSTAFNFGFEQTTVGEDLPTGWFRWGDGYNISIDSEVKHSGNNSVLLKPAENWGKGSFCCAACRVPAVYKGKTIELKAWMKLKEVKDGPIGLLLRVDGESGILAFENMQQKNIQGTSDWKQYSVSVPLPKDAKMIYIGAMLSGTGQLWADDIEVLIDGKTLSDAKRKEVKQYPAEMDKEFDAGSKIWAVPVTGGKVEDLRILGLVWGFVKYYHPAVAAGSFNWDYELFRVMPSVIGAKNSRQRDSVLSAWIAKLGDIGTKRKPAEKKGEIKFGPDIDWISSSGLSVELTRQLLQIKDTKRSKDHYYVSLAEGVGNAIFINEKGYSKMESPDAGFRLLSLYRYWNIIQYYFPYKNLIEEDWKEVLREFIPKFIHAGDALEYRLAMLELISRVHDTHANIWGFDKVLEEYKGVNTAPVDLRFIGTQAVVNDYYDKEKGEASGLLKGDVIVSIQKKRTEEIIKERLKYSAASNYTTQLRNIAEDLLRTNDSVLEVEAMRNGSTLFLKLTTYPVGVFSGFSNYQKKDSCFRMIGADIGYLYLGSLKESYLPQIMSTVKDTKGLIIDLRCYPLEFVIFSLSDYLMPKSKASVKFSFGSITSPGLFSLTPPLKVGKNNKDYYKGKVVVLINEFTQSQAEYTAMALRLPPQAIVIGSQTAGADGNVSQFFLPGGISTMISGIGAYYPDGRETQRIGIVPDIEVKPTIEGIKKGQDEVLQKAVEIINGK